MKRLLFTLLLLPMLSMGQTTNTGVAGSNTRYFNNAAFAGQMKLPISNGVPSAPAGSYSMGKAGLIRFDSTTGTVYIHNGTSWGNIGGTIPWLPLTNPVWNWGSNMVTNSITTISTDSVITVTPLYNGQQGYIYVTGNGYVFGVNDSLWTTNSVPGILGVLRIGSDIVYAPPPGWVTYTPTVPDAPTTAVVNDYVNTLNWTNSAGYTAVSDYEYTSNGGTSYTVATAKPMVVGNVVKAIGQVGVRVKGHLPIHTASATLYNGADYTLDDLVAPTVSSATATAAHTIVVVFDKAVTATNTGYTFIKDIATIMTPTGVTGSGTNTLTFTTTETMTGSSAVVMNYSSGNTQSLYSIPLANITGGSVVNSIPLNLYVTPTKGIMLGNSTMAATGPPAEETFFTAPGYTITNQAVSGANIHAQHMTFLAQANLNTYDWALVRLGLNNRSDAAIDVIDSAQVLLDDIRSHIKVGGKIIWCTETPNGAGTTVYAEWDSMRYWMQGQGTHPLIGADYYQWNHTPALSDPVVITDADSFWLAPAYDMNADGVHMNSAGRGRIGYWDQRSLTAVNVYGDTVSYHYTGFWVKNNHTVVGKFNKKTAGDLTGYTIKKNGVTMSIDRYFLADGVDSIGFITSNSDVIGNSDVITISYSGGNTVDQANNPLPSFTNVTATNPGSLPDYLIWTANNGTLAYFEGGILAATVNGGAYSNTGRSTHTLKASADGGVAIKYEFTMWLTLHGLVDISNAGTTGAGSIRAGWYTPGSPTLYTIENGGLVAQTAVIKDNYYYYVHRAATGVHTLEESPDGVTWTVIYTYPIGTNSTNEEVPLITWTGGGSRRYVTYYPTGINTTP